MARKTRRRSRSKRRRRQRGGSEEPVPEVESSDAPEVESHDAGEDGPGAAPGESEVGSLLGGRRRRRKGRKSKKSRRTHKKRKTRKKGKKRGLNTYFKLMLNAKKKGLASFKYKGKTYKGKKHHRLGMIYKKA